MAERPAVADLRLRVLVTDDVDWAVEVDRTSATALAP
ncbi:MAG: hypothetical protein RL562_2721, partial [Planctomycetota bacterium]